MSYENIFFAMTPGEFDGRYCTGHDPLLRGGFTFRHPMSPQNRPRFAHDRAAGTTKGTPIVNNPGERSTIGAPIINNPSGGLTTGVKIVKKLNGRMTKGTPIVNNPIEKMTNGAPIVNNPSERSTIGPPIVDNPTGGITTGVRIFIKPVVETIKQHGFSAISIADSSKQQTLKTNLHKNQ